VRRRVILAVTALAIAALPASALAAPTPSPYGTDDAGGFRNILPPGTNGSDNAVQLAQFLGTGARPEHNQDQLKMYENLVHAVPGLTAAQLPNFFKDATFGVKAGDAERTYSPRSDVTIVRDKGFGVPHIYGATRAGGMFGIGYATAEDRLFFIDVLRHVGRAELSGFAGGSQGNRDMDHDEWLAAPYTEQDLQNMVDRSSDEYGAEGQQLEDDVANYTAGINAYIDAAKLNPLLMPGEYAAIGKPQGPDPWKTSDVAAIAALVGGIFGKGGGGELQNAMLLQAFNKRFGTKIGYKRYTDFRAADDPEAPTTIKGKALPHRLEPAHPVGRAMPDAGSVQMANPVASAAGAGATTNRSAGILGGADGVATGLRAAFPAHASNALLVSARESQSGHPLAVFGPQVSYFAPQILMEEDIHMPGIDADGSAFPGSNLYVQLGHGRDYAWSATSAGNDIVDVYAVPLCDPAGGAATLKATGYIFHGKCLPIEVLTRTNSWSPTLADSTPAGSETLTVDRTRFGLGMARATIKGKPYLYTQLRSTYQHETDSAIGFAALNSPAQVHDPASFRTAVNKIGFTFNWFYIDANHISYFNSGRLPLRPKNTDTQFPIFSKYEWRNWNSGLNIPAFEGPSTHPQITDPPFLSNWNGKQAPHYAAADNQTDYSAVDRGESLEKRIRAGIKGKKKMSLVQLTAAMEDAGTVDLRATEVLPYALRVIGKPKDPATAAAVNTLRAWIHAGGHRRDVDSSGTYDNSDAVAIMDAWWPKWINAQFGPALGKPLTDSVIGRIGLGDVPNIHQGSSFDDGIWGQSEKDLRRTLGLKVLGWSRTYCGNGKLAACRSALTKSLTAAIAIPRNTLYHTAGCPDGDQICFDQIRFRALGAVTQPGIEWINRPTFQQIVEIPKRLPR
jgi:acyl-homoserine lactone acylase PvdQ